MMNNLRQLVKKINIEGRICFNEPMAGYTSFRIGGAAEVFVEPEDRDSLIRFYRYALKHNIPLFILGGGTNILVADRGIKGVVLSLNQINNITIEDNEIISGAGGQMSDVAAAAGKAHLSGLEFIYSMPGTVGGAVFMNARCYGKEISQVLKWVEWMDAEGVVHKESPKPSEYEYKVSPFQQGDRLILSAAFSLEPAPADQIFEEMEANRKDRESKGHFLYPCAGSVFKNNRAFGRPSGAIIDSLSLRGVSRGEARISEKHANIIVNTGNARGADVVWLIDHCRRAVKKTYGYDLENEVILVGKWED